MYSAEYFQPGGDHIMNRSFVLGFLAGAVVFALLGLLVVNQLFRVQHSLSALGGGSNIYAAMAADLQLGNIQRAETRLRTVAWVDRTNAQYAGCMSAVRWHLIKSQPVERCKRFLETPMPGDWQIPGVDKMLKSFTAEDSKQR
jgi:hypothetical protein